MAAFVRCERGRGASLLPGRSTAYAGAEDGLHCHGVLYVGAGRGLLRSGLFGHEGSGDRLHEGAGQGAWSLPYSGKLRGSWGD